MSHPPARSGARSGGEPSPALRLAILITDAAGEILYWNAQAEAALERLPSARSIQQVDRIFTPATLDHLRRGGRWATVSPIGAPDTSWSVRARYLIDSGRSLFLFFESEASR